MISGDTTVGAFLWWLPAIVHDLRPLLVGLAVTWVVSAAGVVAAILLATQAPVEHPDGEVDPGRLVRMRRSRRRSHRTGAVCATADDTVEVRR